MERIHPQQNPTDSQDRLLTFREVGEMIGLKCKTGHSARALAARGQIRAVRLNGRVIRYSEASVRALIEGKAPVVGGGQ